MYARGRESVCVYVRERERVCVCYREKEVDDCLYHPSSQGSKKLRYTAERERERVCECECKREKEVVVRGWQMTVHIIPPARGRRK